MPPVSHLALRRARSLAELGDIAAAEGLEKGLAAPLSSLIQDSSLDPVAVTVLARAATEVGVDTLGKLLRDRAALGFLDSRAAPLERKAILRAARLQLEASAADGPTEAGDDRSPRTFTELRAWAEENGVGDALSTSVELLQPFLPPAQSGFKASGMAWTSIGELWRYYRQSRSVSLEALRAAGWRYLREQAQAVREGIEEEQRVSQAADPRDPNIAELLAALAKARAGVRRVASPRARERIPSPALRFQPEPPSFIYTEGGRLITGNYRKALVRPEVRISMESWRERGATLVCACAPEEDARCTHALAALDTAAALLANSESSEDARRTIEQLTIPGWGRALRAVDVLVSQADEASRDSDRMRVSWRIRQGPAHLDLLPFVYRRNKRGEFSKGAEVGPERLMRLLGERPLDRDRRAAELVHSARRFGGDYYGSGATALIHQALFELIGHPRVFFDGDEEGPVAVREARVGFTLREGEEGSLSLVPEILGRQVDAGELLKGLQSGGVDRLIHWLDRQGRQCLLVRVEEPALRVLDIIGRFGSSFPPEAHQELAERLHRLGAVQPVTIPQKLKGEELPPARELVLRLSALDEGGLDVELRVRPIPGGAAQPPGEGAAELLGRMGERRVYTRRDFAQEKARACEALVALGLPEEAAAARFGFQLEVERALDLVVRLQEQPPPDLAVEWREDPWRVSEARPADLRVSVADRRDWFGLDGELEVDGERVKLALLLDAARRRQKYVRVDGRRWVAITEELRRRLVPVANLVFEGKSGLEVGPTALEAISDLAADAGRFNPSKTWAELLGRIRSARALDPALPRGLKAELRDYQVEGYRWLRRVAAWGSGACLADDMGLGKTLQALALLLARASEGPALVVAPTSVCFNWSLEAARFAPSLKIHLYGEADRERLLAALKPGDVVVVSYGLLARDIERFQALRFATLVLDEAQNVKNAATRRARAVRDLDAGFRLAMSGTPIENHIGELWSLFRCVFPGLLGSWEHFRERFAAPIEREKNRDRQEALARAIRPFLLRRTKDQVARELPPRTEVTVAVTLSKQEGRLYEDARLAAAARLAGIEESGPQEQKRFEVLAALTRLRLLACHPSLYDSESDIPSSKLERFLEIVEELREEGHRALVFSQFTSHLALVREVLDKRKVRYLYLDGQTPAGKRKELVEAFQAGEGDLFLISLKAGGTGLNLTAADYVIHLDPWWNPAVEDQATDRTHRIGQTKPVTVYRLVAQSTVEEQILAMHADKRALVASLLDGSDAAAGLSTSELLDLIRAGSASVHRSDEADDAGEEADARVEEINLRPRGDAEELVKAAEAPSARAEKADSAEDAKVLPPLLGGTVEALRDRVDEFEAFLAEQRANKAFHSDSTVTSYARSARRFADFVAREAGKTVSASSEPSLIFQRYVEELLSGRLPAPKSEPLVARAALRHLGDFLSRQEP